MSKKATAPAPRRRPAKKGTAHVVKPGARATTLVDRPAQWAVVLLVVTPAVIIPGGLDRFEFGKLVVAAVGVLLAFLAAATGRLPRAASIGLAAGAVVLLVAALTSQSPLVSLLGRAPRYEGLAVLVVYLLAGVVGARLLGPSRPERLTDLVLVTMAWCAIAVAAVGALESVGIHLWSSTVERPGSLLGNASDQGAFGVLYAGPLLVAALRRRRPVEIVGAVAAAATVVLSGSRGALVGLAVVVILLVVLGSRSWKPLLAVLAGIAVAALAVPFTRDRLLGLTPMSGRTITGRGLLWRESLSLLSDHPLLGVGPSQFEIAIVGRHDLAWQQTIGPDNPPGSPHNLFLQAWSAGGLLLVIALIVLVVLVIRGGFAQHRAAASDLGWPAGVLAGLVGYGAALQFHLTSPGTTIPACLFAGSLLAVPVGDKPALDRALRWAVLVLAGCLTIVFAAAALAEFWLLAAANTAGTGRYADADGDYRTAQRLRPWDLELPGQAMTRFVTAGTSGNPGTDKALPFAQAWSDRLGPLADDEQLVQNRAALLQAVGQQTQAAALLDRALAADPYQPQLLVLRGVVHAQRGELDAALAAFTKATEVDPTNAQAWHNLAYVYNAQGKTDLAEATQRKAEALAAGG